MRNLNYRAFGVLKGADYGNQQRVALSYHADRLNYTVRRSKGPAPDGDPAMNDTRPRRRNATPLLLPDRIPRSGRVHI